MALDTGKGTRRPHTAGPADTELQANAVSRSAQTAGGNAASRDSHAAEVNAAANEANAAADHTAAGQNTTGHTSSRMDINSLDLGDLAAKLDFLAAKEEEELLGEGSMQGAGGAHNYADDYDDSDYDADDYDNAEFGDTDYDDADYDDSGYDDAEDTYAEDNAAHRAGGQKSGRRTARGGRSPLPRVRQVNAPEETDDEIAAEREYRKMRKKKHRNRLILMFFVELLTIGAIFCTGFVYRYMHMSQPVEFDRQKVKNENIDIQRQQKMEGYWTVAVFGVDSRDGNVGRGALADVQIIVNVDMGTGDIRLASVYRDSYLNINGKSDYQKINAAYLLGGPEQAVSALNRNLDLDIENYMTFNWKAVADAVTMLGGVDIDITDKEFYYMNAYIHETCIKSGINPKNPAAEYISGPGMQHLDGVQAVAYARLRYMDDDFQRTRRQREVISQCLAKAKKMDLATLTGVIDTVLPQVAYNIEASDIIQLAKGISRYNIRETTGFPTKLRTQMMGKKGDCVIPVTLASNVSALHEFLYGDTGYDPSDAVKRYSQKIADDSGFYKEQATAKATRAPEEESDSKKESTKSTEEEETTKARETDADGYIIKETKENGETVYETDSEGNRVKPTKSVKLSTERAYETDPEGYVIKETDADGHIVYETNADGEKVRSTRSTRETEEGETDEDGNVIMPDDGDSRNTAIEETDADGNIIPRRTAEDDRIVSPGGQTERDDDNLRPGDIVAPGGDDDDDNAPGSGRTPDGRDDDSPRETTRSGDVVSVPGGRDSDVISAPG